MLRKFTPAVKETTDIAKRLLSENSRPRKDIPLDGQGELSPKLGAAILGGLIAGSIFIDKVVLGKPEPKVNNAQSEGQVKKKDDRHIYPGGTSW